MGRENCSQIRLFVSNEYVPIQNYIKGIPLFFQRKKTLWNCPASEVSCRSDNGSTAFFYYHTASFHHQSGGHKIKLGLICPSENIRGCLLAVSERYSDSSYTTPCNNILRNKTATNGVHNWINFVIVLTQYCSYGFNKNFIYYLWWIAV